MTKRHTLESSLAPLVAGLLLLLTLIGLLGTAARDPRPHDIRVGISAPPAVVQQITESFGSAAPGAFQFTTYASEGSVRAAISAREVVAALIVGGSAPRLIVAGAAGDAIAGGVTAAFTNAFRAQNAQLAVEVVHPFQAGDPHGIALFFLVLATLISTVLASALLALRATHLPATGQAGMVFGYAAIAGISAALATAWIVDGYGDKLWQVMALAALLSLAVGAVTAACARTLGPAGVALSALILVLVGLVASGGPLGSELLPDAYRAMAPWMPVGQAHSALRGALYFAGAGVGEPVLVLSGWAATGITGLLITDLARGSRRHPIAVPA